MTKQVEEFEFYVDGPTPIADVGVDSTHVYKVCKKVGIDLDDRFSIRHKNGRWVHGNGSDTEVVARSTNNGHIIVSDPETDETRRFIPTEGGVYCFDKGTGEKKKHPDF